MQREPKSTIPIGENGIVPIELFPYPISIFKRPHLAQVESGVDPEFAHWFTYMQVLSRQNTWLTARVEKVNLQREAFYPDDDGNIFLTTLNLDLLVDSKYHHLLKLAYDHQGRFKYAGYSCERTDMHGRPGLVDYAEVTAIDDSHAQDPQDRRILRYRAALGNLFQQDQHGQRVKSCRLSVSIHERAGQTDVTVKERGGEHTHTIGSHSYGRIWEGDITAPATTFSYDPAHMSYFDGTVRTDFDAASHDIVHSRPWIVNGAEVTPLTIDPACHPGQIAEQCLKGLEHLMNVSAILPASNGARVYIGRYSLDSGQIPQSRRLG